MDEISEVSQVISVTIEGMRLGVEVTKDAVKLLQKLGSILYTAYKYRIRTGKISEKQLLKRDQDVNFVKINTNEYEKFKKLAKKHGILYTPLPSFSTAEDQSVMHILYHSLSAPRMQSVLDILNSTHSSVSNKNEMESAEQYMKESGAMVADKDLFGKELQQKYPEEYKELEQKKTEGNLSHGERKEVEQALTRNEFKRRKDNTDDFTILTFSKAQIVKQNENQIMVKSNRNEDAFMWLDKKDVVKENSFMYSAAIHNEKDIMVTNLSGELNHKMKSISLKNDLGVERLVKVTISKQNIRNENDHAFMTLIPRTKGKEFLWLDKKEVGNIHGGKSILTFLDKQKMYSVYSKDNKLIKKISGSDLSKGHYDQVLQNKQKHIQTQRSHSTVISRR